MGSVTLYVVTRTMQGQPELLKQNGVVVDPDVPNKYYFVHKGSGFSEAMFFREAIDTLVSHLEGKRTAKGENENNGIILLFRGYEELAVIVRAFEWAGHHDVMLGKVIQYYNQCWILDSKVRDWQAGQYGKGII